MFPEPKVQQYLLQYLAHLVQRPAVKIKSAILMQSRQGVGKNLLLTAVAKMFHQNDVGEYYGSIISERFQADLGNRLIATLDEMQVDELSAAYNKLKRWVTEERNLVERKGVDAFEVRTPRGMFILTNHAVPIKIDADDRRIAVFRIEAEKRDSSYYKKLTDEGFSDSAIAAFKHYLQGMKLGDFNPNAEPPVTDAKLALISASLPVTEQVLLELRDAEMFPFNKPIYLADEVAKAVGERMRRVVVAQQVTPILARLGDMKTEQKITIGNFRGHKSYRAYVWSWRNQSYWTTASKEAIRAEFDASAMSNLSLVSQPSAEPSYVQLSH